MFNAVPEDVTASAPEKDMGKRGGKTNTVGKCPFDMPKIKDKRKTAPLCPPSGPKFSVWLRARARCHRRHRRGCVMLGHVPTPVLRVVAAWGSWPPLAPLCDTLGHPWPPAECDWPTIGGEWWAKGGQWPQVAGQGPRVVPSSGPRAPSGSRSSPPDATRLPPVSRCCPVLAPVSRCCPVMATGREVWRDGMGCDERVTCV